MNRTKNDLTHRLLEILCMHAWFMKAMDAVSGLNLPNWYVGGGVIRNIVFDHLEGHTHTTPIRDVDVAYFDPRDLSREQDQKLEEMLRLKMPDFQWDVTNQAGVHLWYHRKFGGDKMPPFCSTEEGIATWPEPCTAVALTQAATGAYHIYAPLGLKDLFGLIVRRNPARVDLKTYNDRIRRKRYDRCWKSVRIVL